MFDPIHFEFFATFPGLALPSHEVRPDVWGEMIIGEPIEFSARAMAGPLSCAVASAPPGSSAQFNGARFVADVPGTYTLLLANGGARITHKRVAFHPEALQHPAVADANFIKREPYSEVPVHSRSYEDRRVILRSMASGAFASSRVGVVSNGFLPDEVFAALTPARPLPSGLDLSRFPGPKRA